MKIWYKQAKSTLAAFLSGHGWILAVMLLLFIERLLAMKQLGFMYVVGSDDVSYVKSGITFAKTGMITMHGVLSAQIMPGMPVFIGLVSLLFGEGELLWLVLKLIWIMMGVWTAFFVYKSVLLFAPRWCGIAAALLFFTPDFAWMDNLILTETPFMLLLSALIYSTLMLAKTRERKYFRMCLACYMPALMLKANIGIYPVFALIYLLMKRYDFKVLLKQGLIVTCVLLGFIIPWSIRNYIHYDAFIPLTYGAGNPLLLGTYQGAGYPDDSLLDYETNVEMVAKEKFKKYGDEDGNINEPYLKKYVSLETDGIKARYRISEWFRKDPESLIKSYFYIKPKYMITSTFYWKPIFGVAPAPLRKIRTIGFCITALAFLSALLLKKRRGEMVFLGLLYLGNIYIYALTFAFERYAQTLLPIRYIAFGIGLCLFVEIGQCLFGKIMGKIFV